jgi:hypothetical protein
MNLYDLKNRICDRCGRWFVPHDRPGFKPDTWCHDCCLAVRAELSVAAKKEGFKDQTLVCQVCGTHFQSSALQGQKFSLKSWPLPKRCPACNQIRHSAYKLDI